MHLIRQVLQTGFLLFCLYLFFPPLWEVEYDGFITLLVHLVIIPVAMITPAILAAIIAGLPLRLNTDLRSKWLKHQWIALTGILAGMILFSLTAHKAYFYTVLHLAIDGQSVSKLSFGPSLGWMLMAFCTLHFSPSQFFIKRNRK